MEKSKTLSLAISAIQNLKELRGSNSRDIINYITNAYKLDQDVVTKQVRASLKRGVAYGILKSDKGHYTFPIDTEIAGQEVAAQEIGLIEMCAKKRTGKRNNFCKNRRCRRQDCGKKGGKSCPCSKRRNKISNKDSKSRKTADSKNVDKLFGETLQGLKKKQGRRGRNDLY